MAVKDKIMNAIPGTSIKTAYFLNEGLFEEIDGVSTKGDGSTMVNVLADAGKMLIASDLVEIDTSADKTVKKCATNVYMGYIVADPVGVPPTIRGMDMREATVDHIQAGCKYHVKLADANAECSPGNYIVATANVFDVSATKVAGVVLMALESATANSGKYIDVICLDTNYVAYALVDHVHT